MREELRQTLQEILYDTELRVKEFQEKMTEFENNPMLLLTEVFVNDDILLPMLIQRYGDQTLLDTQEYWYSMLFPKLIQYFGVENIRLAFDPSIYPAPIQIFWGEDLVAYLDIIGHQFERTEPEEIIEIRQRLVEIQTELQVVENELKEKEPALENVFVLGGANIIKLLDISFRQKKYKKEVRESVRELQDYYFELDRERIRLEQTIENLRKNSIEREYVIDRIEQRILQLPGYKRVIDWDEEKNSETERGFLA